MRGRTAGRPGGLRRGALAAALVGLLVVAACAPGAEEARPVLLIGIDGAEWRVIEGLWEQGRLPHLRRLAETGTRGPLATAWTESPVIWTTVATGVLPEEHGIQGFVVPTPDGFTSVSSEHRTAPALWDMLTRSQRRSAVLGWWPTWPAETISGLMVTERILTVDHRRYSGEPAAVVEDALTRLEPDLHSSWTPDSMLRRDRLMTAIAEQLGDERFDLVMVYLRATDIVSHLYWSAYEPDRFPDADLEALAPHRDEIGRVYDEIDRLVGRMVGALGPDVNILVLSDHGFRAAIHLRQHADVDIDRLLRLLGLQAEPGGQPDPRRGSIVGFDNIPTESPKKLKFTGPGPAAAVREELARALARVTWSDGSPAFSVVESDLPHHRPADALVEVHVQALSMPLRIDGEPVEGVVESIRTTTGTHDPRDAGILIASGPDFAAGATLEDARVHDIAPTVLYALDLPVGADFAGRALTELFDERLRSRRAVREIPTWGRRRAGDGVPADDDAEQIEQLKGLGYL